MPENPEANDKVDLTANRIVGEVYITHIFAESETVHVRGIPEPIYLTDAITDTQMVGTGRAKVKIERDQDGDLVMHEYEVVPDHVVTPFVVPTYTRERGATVKLTQAVAPVEAVPCPPEMEWTLHWSLIAEARRLVGLASNDGNARAARVLSAMLEAHDGVDVDAADLVNREGATLETVLFHALHNSAERFNPDPADPGWFSDMHEDALRDACLAYVQAFLTRRAHAR